MKASEIQPGDIILGHHVDTIGDAVYPHGALVFFNASGMDIARVGADWVIPVDPPRRTFECPVPPDDVAEMLRTEFYSTGPLWAYLREVVAAMDAG